MRAWLLTIAIFVGFAGPAHAYVYWTDGDAGTIGRANLDGSGVVRDFITGASSPSGIAVDEHHVYWTNRGTGTIGRADLDGSHVDHSWITGASNPTGVAVDGSYVYWTNTGTDAIGRASLDRSGVDHTFITGENDPFGIASSPRGLYWTDANRIRRANRDGSGVATISTDGDDRGLAADGTRLVWATDQPAILLADLLPAGGLTNGRVVSFVAARSVALDAQSFYWTAPGGIGRTDGTTSQPAFIAAADPEMVAVDGGQSGTATPSSPTLDFGSGLVDRVGASRTLRITNDGPGPLELGVARVTGAAEEDFLLGPDTCSGERLALLATCTIAVVFAPADIGERRATLTLPSNDAASPLDVALVGTGEDPDAPGFDDPPFFDDEPDEFDDEPEAAQRPRLVTCRIVGERRRCRTRRLRGTPNFRTPGTAHATLTRRGVVYGTGTARASRVVIDLHRRVRPGRYRLTLRRGGDIVRRVRITIRAAPR